MTDLGGKIFLRCGMHIILIRYDCYLEAISAMLDLQSDGAMTFDDVFSGIEQIKRNLA